MVKPRYRVVQPREFNYYHVDKRVWGFWFRLGYTKTEGPRWGDEAIRIQFLPVLCSESEIKEVIDYTGIILSSPFKFATVELAEYFIKLMTNDEKIERANSTDKVLHKYDNKGTKLDV